MGRDLSASSPCYATPLDKPWRCSDEDPGRHRRRRPGGPAAGRAAAPLRRAQHRGRAAQRRVRARPHPRRRAGADHGGPAGRGRRRRAPARRRPAARRLRDVLRRPAPPHRPVRPDRQARHRLRPDRGDARPDGRAQRPGSAHRLRGAGGQRARLRRQLAARALPEGRPGARDRLRLHRRLRRLPRRVPRQRAAVGAAHLREGLCLRLAGPAGRRAAGGARADLREPRARLRAVQHAQQDAQPLLRAVRAGRRHRPLVGRGLLGRAEAAAAARHRPSTW